jgi:hypothetical protein
MRTVPRGYEGSLLALKAAGERERERERERDAAFGSTRDRSRQTDKGFLLTLT